MVAAAISHQNWTDGPGDNGPPTVADYAAVDKGDIGGAGTVQLSQSGILSVAGNLEIGNGDATSGSSVTVDP